MVKTATPARFAGNIKGRNADLGILGEHKGHYHDPTAPRNATAVGSVVENDSFWLIVQLFAGTFEDLRLVDASIQTLNDRAALAESGRLDAYAKIGELRTYVDKIRDDLEGAADTTDDRLSARLDDLESRVRKVETLAQGRIEVEYNRAESPEELALMSFSLGAFTMLCIALLVAVVPAVLDTIGGIL